MHRARRAARHGAARRRPRGALGRPRRREDHADAGDRPRSAGTRGGHLAHLRHRAGAPVDRRRSRARARRRLPAVLARRGRRPRPRRLAGGLGHGRRVGRGPGRGPRRGPAARHVERPTGRAWPRTETTPATPRSRVPSPWAPSVRGGPASTSTRCSRRRWRHAAARARHVDGRRHRRAARRHAVVAEATELGAPAHGELLAPTIAACSPRPASASGELTTSPSVSDQGRSPACASGS